MADVKSGSSLRTVSPREQVASNPGVSAAVLMGMRERIDSRRMNSVGRLTTGSCRGRNPLVVDTMKAGSAWSLGLVSARTLNLRGADGDIVVMEKL